MPHKRRVVFYIVERGRIRGDDGVPAPNHQRSPKGPDDPGFGDISKLYLADYPAMSLIFGNKDQKYKSVELGDQLRWRMPCEVDACANFHGNLLLHFIAVLTGHLREQRNTFDQKKTSS